MGYSPRGRKESDTTERLHSLTGYGETLTRFSAVERNSDNSTNHRVVGRGI